MIDYISDKLISKLIDIKILKDDQYSDYDYYFRIILFNVIILTSLYFIGTKLNCLAEFIVIGIVFNTIRVYCEGFHARLDICIIITLTLMTSCGIAVNMIGDYSLLILMLFIPLTRYGDNSKYFALLLGYTVVGISCYILGITWITSAISMAFVLLTITLTNFGMEVLGRIEKFLDKFVK